jgi:hypothetical protein
MLQASAGGFTGELVQCNNACRAKEKNEDKWTASNLRETFAAFRKKWQSGREDASTALLCRSEDESRRGTFGFITCSRNSLLVARGQLELQKKKVTCWMIATAAL